ncbi:unnamed protein product [Diabrotica balteata]|uniref:Uncharacterized protein n=1 Tax=Diabrotica balteata TaxID=107213 RepID=A0A9N9X9W3_DIABA|nr:unnamed protein product [Diabrotica balteata]
MLNEFKPFLENQNVAQTLSAARLSNETPQFSGPIQNVTVALGREAVLSCTVTDLGHYKRILSQGIKLPNYL